MIVNISYGLLREQIISNDTYPICWYKRRYKKGLEYVDEYVCHTQFSDGGYSVRIIEFYSNNIDSNPVKAIEHYLLRSTKGTSY